MVGFRDDKNKSFLEKTVSPVLINSWIFIGIISSKPKNSQAKPIMI